MKEFNKFLEGKRDTQWGPSPPCHMQSAIRIVDTVGLYMVLKCLFTAVLSNSVHYNNFPIDRSKIP